MLILEKNENNIRAVGELTSWFLKDWRPITNEIFENGFRVVSEVDLQIEIEGNVFIFSVTDLLVDGISFSTSEDLKNYLLNG